MSAIGKNRTGPSPLRPSSLRGNANLDDGGEVDLARLRDRFDGLRPKYGFLWRSMADTRLARGGDCEGGGVTKRTPANSKGSKSLGTEERAAAEDKENVDPTQRRRSRPGAGAADFSKSKRDSEANANGGTDETDGSGPVENGDENERFPDFLDAILRKRPVSLRVLPDHDNGLCGEGCACADPVIEIDDDDDEDASTYDADDGELVDTDDEEEGGKGKERDRTSSGVQKVGTVEWEDGLDDGARIEDVPTDDEEDDESVLVVGKTPRRRKKIIIDSDDDEEEESIGGSIENVGVDDDSFVKEKDGDTEYEETGNPFVMSDVSMESESIHSLNDDIEEDEDDDDENDLHSSSRRTSVRNRGPKVKSAKTLRIADYVDDDGDERLSSSEEEWVEISSDEEDEGAAQPERRVNTIIILSSDEEEESASESESENDDRSAFTISDVSESEASESSSRLDGRRRTRGGRRSSARDPSSPGRPTKTKTTTKKKSRKIFATPKDNARPNNTRVQSSARSTLAFRKNRDTLTAHTFAEFNQRAFRNVLSSVEVTWSNKLNTTAGRCRMRGKQGDDNAHTRVAMIELATKVIDDEDRLRSTLLHEMCHAAQWLVDGTHKPPHGKCFKKWAAISMRNIRDVEVTTTHDYQIAYKFAWACTASNCSVVIKRHSRSVDPTKHCCGRCQGKLIEIEVPGSKGDTAMTGHTAKKQRKASGFALFVKDRSTKVRRGLARDRACSPREVSQEDVMKECGRLWRIQKESLSEEESGGVGKDGLEVVADRLVNLTLNDGGYP